MLDFDKYWYLYLIHWVVNPIVIGYLVQLLWGNIRYLSIPYVFIASYFLFIYLRALEIYIADYHEHLFMIAVWLVPYIFIFFTSAWFLLLDHGRKKQVTAFFRTDFSVRDIQISNFSPLISFFFISLPLFYLLDKGIQNIAAFFLIFNPGEARETMILRIGGLTSNFGPFLTLIYAYSRALLYPIYTGVLVALHSRGLVSRVHLWSVIVAATLFSLFTAAKAPLAYLLMIVLLSKYFSNKGNLKSRKFLLMAFLSLFIPALLYPLWLGSTGGEALIVAISMLWRRITLIPSQASAIYFDAFTSAYSHAGFSSNRWLALIFQEDYQSTASLIYNDFLQGNIPGGLVNASYFASLFADWGMAGAVLGTILIALLLASFQIFLDRCRADALTIGIRAVVLVATAQLMMTNVYSVLAGRGLLSATLLLLILNSIFPKKNDFRKLDTGHRG
ncbi:hypothetical protein XM38_017600 [Halomicronema hongdechloris C2206]|uniref:Oligosaccharide repeat unit polymerase n=1 Tax=Halomicronema hongdechloris C2206 TaxID=1641165 RepID=A0A1Z3HKJ3_9CYAN|nr:hypothetical protein [Halomicronema hongdechloris]ASC70813.1 hypothetical protein XM38_017600 [Halomicronema hongdechloris C2206]